MGQGLSALVPVPDEKPDYTAVISMTAEVQVEDVIKATEDAGKAILEVYNSEASPIGPTLCVQPSNFA